MRIDVKLKSNRTLLKFKKAKEQFPRITFKSIERAAILLENEIVKNLTAGKFGVKTRTNRLRGSIGRKFSATKGNKIRDNHF